MKQLFYLSVALCLLTSCKNPKTNNSNTKNLNVDTIATYSWSSGLCDYKGNYNPQKYTLEQLKNTYDLYYTYAGVSLSTDGTASKPEDIDKLSVSELTKEYQKKKELYSTLKIVDNPYWENLKKLRIQELEDEYELKKTTIESYKNPSVLQSSRFAKSCPEIVATLNTKDDLALLSFWKKFVLKHHKENKLPQSHLDKFQKENASPNRLLYARIELTAYGWWNSANAQLRRVEQTEEMEKSFEQLFTNVTVECEEP